MARRSARAIAAAGMGALALAAATAAPAQGADQTCVLALTKFDPATVNVAYPDDSAHYYSGAYAAVPGARIRIAGEFPHARYMSLTVYDPALRPLDGLTDVAIEPDAGSTNPFVEGADRTGADRSYTVFIDPGAPPPQRAPNTLYAGEGQAGAPNAAGLFVYRIYIPDGGRDETGDVGLPTVTLEAPGSGAGPARSPCADLAKPRVEGVNERIAAQALPDTPRPSAGEPPRWRKFVNVFSSISHNALGTPKPAGFDLDELGGNGGFLSNLDVAYVAAGINRAHGQVVVTRVRAPTFADTRHGAPTMPGGQLRYWSLCQNDTFTQRFIACVNDDRAVLAGDGTATFVVSTPAQRPPSATAACGVNWIPWGPNQRGGLIFRHMLPDPGFAQSVQLARPDHEEETMGDYLPRSAYFADAATYEEAVGCAP